MSLPALLPSLLALPACDISTKFNASSVFSGDHKERFLGNRLAIQVFSITSSVLYDR